MAMDWIGEREMQDWCKMAVITLN